MRILYFDCFSGASGDMILGALVDAGLPLDALREALGSLAVDGCRIDAARVMRAGVAATKFLVQDAGAVRPAASPSGHAPDHHDQHDHHHEDHHHHHHHHDHAHRTLKEIDALIERSALSPAGRERAKALFARLGEAEAAVHQMPLDQVHLHEVGAIDSIVDIVGAVFGLEWIGVDRIVASPLNVGGGTVQTAHGRYPVPAPATVELLQDVPVYSGPVRHELVTPTGALLISAYAESYGGMPAMTVERAGYGAGDRDFPETPNVLRVVVGRAADRAAGERVVVIECEIDDMNPQIFGAVMDRLYEAGALEVFYVPVQMKKNRPGTLMTVVAPPEGRAALADLIFRETTTIGVRYAELDRECLSREWTTVETPAGDVRIKIARRNGRIVNAAPEFDDCARLAAEKGLPVKDVQALAIQAYGARRLDPAAS